MISATSSRHRHCIAASSCGFAFDVHMKPRPASWLPVVSGNFEEERSRKHVPCSTYLLDAVHFPQVLENLRRVVPEFEGFVQLVRGRGEAPCCSRRREFVLVHL